MYGLSAALWTKDLARGDQAAGRLAVVAVNINDGYANIFTINLPHGGYTSLGGRVVARPLAGVSRAVAGATASPDCARNSGWSATRSRTAAPRVRVTTLIASP